ncbi:MAG: hypothetical protein U1A27_14270 [Phycisphaerae bacterium]
MFLRNSSSLDTYRLDQMFRAHLHDWPHDNLLVAVRHARGAPFSGACHYRQARIYINLGRGLRYPYPLATHLARARATRFAWRRAAYSILLPDAYALALFLFLHEFYHWLVFRARRNPRQKEGRCDRFAARALVDGLGLAVVDADARPVERHEWDFQDLDGFVAAARRTRPALGGASCDLTAARREWPATPDQR